MKIKTDSKYKWADLLLIISCISSLLPLFLLSVYNNPANDDYTYALRDVNRNIFDVIFHTYQTWSGRYFATAIGQLNPLTFHSLTAYKAYPVVLLLFFSFSFFYLFHSLFKGTLSRLKICSISMFFILLFLFQTPSSSEAFYWFSGYAAYTVPAILTLILGAILIKKRNLLQQITAVALTILIIGGNEVSACILFSILLYINIVPYIQKKQINKQNALLLFVSAICLAIVVLSPGNSIRSEGETTSCNLIWTIGGSLLQSFSWFVVWGQTLLLASIVYITLFGIKIANSENEKLNKLFSIKWKYFILFFFLTLFLAHIPPFWGLGTVVIGRIANVIYLFFIFSWFFGIQLIINKYKKQIPSHNNSYLKYLYATVLVAFLLNNVFNINNNVATSYVDLITGRASNYNEELEKRRVLIENNNNTSQVIMIPVIDNLPKTIYFNDISNDENYWANRSYKEYWNCKAKIKKEDRKEYSYSNFEALKLFGKNIRNNKFSRQ